jgi:hypothetical protein
MKMARIKTDIDLSSPYHCRCARQILRALIEYRFGEMANTAKGDVDIKKCFASFVLVDKLIDMGSKNTVWWIRIEYSYGGFDFSSQLNFHSCSSPVTFAESSISLMTVAFRP